MYINNSQLRVSYQRIHYLLFFSSVQSDESGETDRGTQVGPVIYTVSMLIKYQLRGLKMEYGTLISKELIMAG